jgi:hypothetical protein
MPTDTGGVIDIGCIGNATGLAGVASAHPRQLHAQGGGQAGALRPDEVWSRSRTYTAEVVAATSHIAGARQGMACFLEECPPKWPMVEFLGATVSLPSYLRREVTTAGGQRQHTMSYAIHLDQARYGGSP